MLIFPQYVRGEIFFRQIVSTIQGSAWKVVAGTNYFVKAAALLALGFRFTENQRPKPLQQYTLKPKPQTSTPQSPEFQFFQALNPSP